MTAEEERTLKNGTLFTGFTEEEIIRLRTIFRSGRRQYKKGDCLIAVGDPIRAFGILLSGAVEVFIDDVNGNHIVMANVLPGKVFAQAMVCSGVEESPIYAVATQDCAVLWCQGKVLLDPAVYADPLCARFAVNFLRSMGEMSFRFNERIQVLSKRSIRDKLITFFSQQISLQKSRTLTLEMDRGALADYLGVERTALSRELSRMRSDGMIEYRKNHFTVY